MSPLLVFLALIATGGAVVAVSAREPRLATLGMLIALLATAYVAEPLPGMVALAARLVGTVLAGYLVWVALRDVTAAAVGPHLGWPGAAAIAIAAFVAGWLAAAAAGAALASLPLSGPSIGIGAQGLVTGSPVSRAAVGTASALVALAVGPVLINRGMLRVGLGLLLMVCAAELLVTAMTGPTDDIVVLAFGLLIAVTGGAVAALVTRSIRAHGDLELRRATSPAVTVRPHGVDDAHPVGRRR
jgi:hypothetical protein